MENLKCRENTYFTGSPRPNKSEAGIDWRALFYEPHHADLSPAFCAPRPPEASGIESTTALQTNLETDYFRITWLSRLYFWNCFIPLSVHSQCIFIFYLLLNSLTTLVGGCLFLRGGVGWQHEAFSFMSQKLPDHFLKTNALRPYFRGSDTMVTRTVWNLDLFLTSTALRPPPTLPWTILTQGPFLEHRIARGRGYMKSEFKFWVLPFTSSVNLVPFSDCF